MDDFEFIINYISLPREKQQEQLFHFKNATKLFFDDYRQAKVADNQKKKEEMEKKMQRLLSELQKRVQGLRQEIGQNISDKEALEAAKQVPGYDKSFEKDLIDFFQTLRPVPTNAPHEEKKPDIKKKEKLPGSRRKHWKKT
ncbi:MAG: hypothetical protein A3F09_01500 [Chlamydiae bacterium RIFCSPHIGHO2_12_FULL_49_11]|nr:MAG: hypothetical protein A3F09_01500 [Chlamydiae bacterium RIFCSPHIGHO2_12_FULL_49_11]